VCARVFGWSGGCPCGCCVVRVDLRVARPCVFFVWTVCGFGLW